ncbi:MAG: lipoyl synthase [Verrucomicrobia bacterium GWF2_51_19]|nr:MAG: lipoyl synthase [Verrucomicrobia bacterium GWF2_51_19]HCJ11562.1 lipoyl synthase [Opitutae bacterium]
MQDKPTWLKAIFPRGDGYNETVKCVRENGVHTVCESAQCPNIGECWAQKTATFLILGNVCTRNCAFCAIQKGRPPLVPDPDEPKRVAEAIAAMGLRYAVITSVTRDDLNDGGAQHWANTIRAIRTQTPQVRIEVLIPDFWGKEELLDIVFREKPDVLNHNLETVKSLQASIRKVARYDVSLKVLQYATQAGLVAKSGLMLGLGETDDEVREALVDLRKVGCQRLTLGQYLQPTPKHAPVKRWVTPQQFVDWKTFALALGFAHVESGPLVRSSYHAGNAVF